MRYYTSVPINVGICSTLWERICRNTCKFFHTFWCISVANVQVIKILSYKECRKNRILSCKVLVYCLDDFLACFALQGMPGFFAHSCALCKNETIKYSNETSIHIVFDSTFLLPGLIDWLIDLFHLPSDLYRYGSSHSYT
jgi:hypothetical protein